MSIFLITSISQAAKLTFVRMDHARISEYEIGLIAIPYCLDNESSLK